MVITTLNGKASELKIIIIMNVDEVPNQLIGSRSILSPLLMETTSNPSIRINTNQQISIHLHRSMFLTTTLIINSTNNNSIMTISRIGQ